MKLIKSLRRPGFLVPLFREREGEKESERKRVYALSWPVFVAEKIRSEARCRSYDDGPAAALFA